MKYDRLKKFKRWYSVVVLVIVLAFLIATIVNWGKPAAYLYGCFGVLSALMLVVTNTIIKQLLPKEKQSKFRNHKEGTR